MNFYDILKARRKLRWASLGVLTLLLGLLMTRQTYEEDISAFLPLDHDQQEAFREYQNSRQARRIYILFQGRSEQEASDLFCELLEDADSTHKIDYTTADDPEMMQEAMQTMFARLPVMLTAEDYARMDSLVAEPGFIASQLEADKQKLMLPTAGMADMQIRYDPLNLFTPHASFHIPHASFIISLISPYDASETDHNGQLLAQLQEMVDHVSKEYPDVDIRMTGGPVIAVGNARQIKADSTMAISLAAVLTCLLLWLALGSVRHVLLIALSISWGWLFAMGCLTLVHHDVSVIVIGISSVILGIAVNYPLHLIAHLRHAADVPTALREIVTPLVVGNITTVGAFLALVPLESVALRDLGLFSAFLLIGTMGFVLLWLPHMITRRNTKPSFLERTGNVHLENRRWIIWAVAVLTVVLGCFCGQTSFDADVRNINYMTDEQKQDMELMGLGMSDGNDRNEKLALWNEWRESQGKRLCRQLRAAADQAGFEEDAFDGFYKLMATTPTDDMRGLTATIISQLTDNFNYIGWTCGCIVFVFLWLSFGCIELAILSFLPMAVSWIWILGIMGLLDIHFNVVNIILATFIFGQGDDYTIFMTEGCQYEYAYRRRMLSSYKHVIAISALMMLIGIGVLMTAKHPALRSLAEVTIIGMFCVVLMAWLLPPLIFRWMVYTHGQERQRPLTLRNMLWRGGDQTAAYVKDCYRYRGVEITTVVNRRLSRHLREASCQLQPNVKTVVMTNSGWGEVVMYEALKRPDVHFVAIEGDDDKRAVAMHVAEHRAPNITFLAEMPEELKGDDETLNYEL